MKGIKRVMPVRSLPPVGTQRGAYIQRDVGGSAGQTTGGRGAKQGREVGRGEDPLTA